MLAPRHYTLVVIKNDPAEITRVSAIVETMGREHNIAAAALYAINLAVEEILTNVISYGYADQDEHQIVVRLACEEGEFVAEIEDDGRPFNPVAAPTPNVETPWQEKPLGGLGIHLTKTMLDGMEYRRVDEKNILTMRKKMS